MLAQAFGREAGILVRGADDIVGVAVRRRRLPRARPHLPPRRAGARRPVARHARRRARAGSPSSVALGVTAAFVAYMLWAVARFVYESWKFNEVAQGLIKIPIWIPQLSFVARRADLLRRGARRAGRGAARQKPAYQLAEEARRAAGDFSETV